MTLAIVADIHGNMPAFEAVVDDISAQGIDDVIVNGDMVGRGPQGDAVVQRVRALGWPCVRGNHEEYLLNFAQDRIPEEWRHAEEWAASRWMAAELSASSLDFIDDLPFSLRRGDLFIVHGTPTSTRRGIGPWTRDADIEPYFDGSARVLVCAHTHTAMLRHLPGARVVVNVGAVGLPFNGDDRAQYAIFRDDGAIELRGVEYERNDILQIYEDSGFLAEGGITATLLRHELVRARPFLVPFQRWCAAQDLVADSTQLPAFLAWHNPLRPITEILSAIAQLTPRGAQ
jgi:diadenosine tetraphosphatase ApaH/serine/threonine PP2A family protein phosphatase